jgi:hypothetical protein
MVVADVRKQRKAIWPAIVAGNLPWIHRMLGWIDGADVFMAASGDTGFCADALQLLSGHPFVLKVLSIGSEIA